jgi:hypothetical protein
MWIVPKPEQIFYNMARSTVLAMPDSMMEDN